MALNNSKKIIQHIIAKIKQFINQRDTMVVVNIEHLEKKQQKNEKGKS